MTADPHRIKLMLLTVGLDIGGTERQVADLALRFNADRYDVSVCVLKEEGSIGRELRRRGVRVLAMRGAGKWDAGVLVRLWRTIRREKPDIIHSFLLLANIVGRVLGRILHVPVVIGSYRGVEIHGARPLLFMDRVTSAWAHAWTCCSQAVCRVVESRIAEEKGKSVVIHNGIDILRFEGNTSLTRAEIGLRDGVPTIGTVCRLTEPVKGLTSLLCAVQQILAAPAMPDVRLVLVGDGPARRRLEAEAKKLGIAERVVFAGMRTNVEAILPLIDLFVLPSQYEGFGIALVEAMASARPVVATAVGGIPEIVLDGETGLLVPPGDVTRMADAMVRLLSDAETAAAYGAAGQRRAREKFSMEIAVDRHQKLYEDLLARSAASERRSGAEASR